MNYLDTIATTLDLTRKQQNFLEDSKNLQTTLQNLQELLAQVNQRDLPLHIKMLLNQHLQETQELLNNLSKRSRSWWIGLQKILPGSDIRKLVDNNNQLLHTIKILNLYLTMGRKSKRSALSFLPNPSELIAVSNPIKRLKTIPSREFTNLADVPLRKSATSMNIGVISRSNSNAGAINALSRSKSNNSLGLSMLKEEKGELAFKLKMLYEARLENTINQAREVEGIIERYWRKDEDRQEYTFHRADFTYLPNEDSTRLSRDHAVLTVIREKRKKNDTEMLEEGKNSEEYNYKYVLKDLSLNGTFYLKGVPADEEQVRGIPVQGNFVQMSRNTEVELEHGDVIGLIMQKPLLTELTFGFQLFTY